MVSVTAAPCWWNNGDKRAREYFDVCGRLELWRGKRTRWHRYPSSEWRNEQPVSASKHWMRVEILASPAMHDVPGLAWHGVIRDTERKLHLHYMRIRRGFLMFIATPDVQS